MKLKTTYQEPLQSDLQRILDKLEALEAELNVPDADDTEAVILRLGDSAHKAQASADKIEVLNGETALLTAQGDGVTISKVTVQDQILCGNFKIVDEGGALNFIYNV